MPDTTAATELRTYTVTVTHPDLSGPLVFELVGATERGAIARCRLSAFHMYRDVRMLDADYQVTDTAPFTPTDRKD